MDDNTPPQNIGKIENAPLVEEMQRSYLDYAMSVIVSRALPDVRDGLKPVQRRIIYAMSQQGLHHTARYQKSAAVVGEVLKNYHPHGDAPVYEAMVRMAQDFSMRYPMVDGQGNFGSVDGDSPAAMRYTEARLSAIADELLRDINKDTVDFTENYSGTTDEPVWMPTVVPNLLLNGAQGIAVGMATQIPPHNLGEVTNALIFMIEHPAKESKEAKATEASKETKVEPTEPQELRFGQTVEELKLETYYQSSATVEDLMKFIKGPDFPTGASIYDISEFQAAYATGKGRVVMRAKAEIEEARNGRFDIVITELPYQVNKAVLIAKMADPVKNKKNYWISYFSD